MANPELDDLPKHKPHERQITDEEYDAGPDFAGIAERIEHMDRLGDDGWWGDFDSRNWEDESILRTLGWVLARSAVGEAEWSGPAHDYSPTASLLNATADCLDHFSQMTGEGSPGLSAWAERSMKDLLALAEAIERNRARDFH